MNVTDSFRDAMAAVGVNHPGPILADGQFRRFKSGDDHNPNSWYVLHAGPPAAGAFGCWRLGIKEKWCERERGAGARTAAEWQQVRDQWRRADAERERAEAERHAEARAEAVRILEDAKPPQRHGYLDRKSVKVFGDLREYCGKLVLPLCDASGSLHSLQFVGADGAKKFLTGGRVAGGFFTLCDREDGPLSVCEGYATGASICEATGYATVAAMNCGNLLAVAQALRSRWPEREIIMAADDDRETPGNPGFAKATEAAKSVGARLAVPLFADTTTKGTDFNDLAACEGIDIVKKQIEAATLSKESDDDAIARLAALPPLEYERCRETEAGKLKTRSAILDKLVASKRPKPESRNDELQGRAMNLPDVEPWPEAVNGADVLTEVANTFRRYLALPAGAADALALWVAHSHAFTAFVCSPRLNISSPEKGCGKTTARDVTAALVPRPLSTENLSVAVLFRIVSAHQPTLLADEVDAWLKDSEEIRGLLNAGHRRGGQALRCEGEGLEVRAFPVYTPTVLCGIGSLPGTLHDRSIIILLERAKSGELLERFDSRHIERETALCRKLARWCADNFAKLEVCDPALPSRAFNRLADNWRPLFAIAETAGGAWPQRAADAFAKLTSGTDMDAQGIGVMLLTDIRQALDEAPETRMFSDTLVSTLCAMADRPWLEAHRGKPITQNWLAQKLKQFRIASRSVRIGNDTAKGYHRADFDESFARYLPPPEESKRHNVTTVGSIGESSPFKASQPETVLLIETPVSINNGGPCDVVTDSKPGGCGRNAEYV